MKKSFLLILIVAANNLIGQIEIDHTSEWQQFIPLITGGKSISITNIHIQGNISSQFGHYIAHQGELGLTSGILMTSGVVEGPDGPLGPNNQTNAGTDNGETGHPLADLISGTDTYNAAVIEFDFSSPIQDTLQINYLFGSEEYKEFVGTQYNDAFGFYVTSGPGITTPYNIALLPGTNIPIAINNVNHLAYSGYYHDNEIANPAYNIIQYDGFVRLATEPFPLIPDSVYHIVLVVADASDGIYDSGVFLELNSGTQDLCGTIYYDGIPAGPGRVDLMGYRLDTADAFILQTYFTDNSGDFSFPDVPFGGYLIRSELNPLYFPSSYPVYIDSAHFWNDARIVYIPKVDTTCMDLYHKTFTIGNGQGELSGLILGTFVEKTIGINQAPELCFVYAYDAWGNLAAISPVNEFGKYHLKGLQDGSYYIKVDKPYYDQIEDAELVISNGEPQSKINFLVNDNDREIAVIKEEISPVSLEITPFPNPSGGNFNLLFNTTEIIRELNIQVVDSRGRVIYQKSMNSIPVGYSSWHMDLTGSSPASGLYFISATGDNILIHKKILINQN